MRRLTGRSVQLCGEGRAEAEGETVNLLSSPWVVTEALRCW